MVLFLLLIPIACILVLHFKFHHRTHIGEYIGQLSIPALIILICKVLMGNLGIWDTEYHGGWTTRAVYEEDWDEYVHQTCTREVASGTDSNGNTTYTTETYDCSYIDYHPERWWKQDSNGDTHSISKGEYLHLRGLWGGQTKTGHHSGYTNSGDIFTTTFDGTDKNMDVVITTHKWVNKVAASNSVFNFPEVDNPDVFEYPKPTGTYTPSVLGYKNCRCFDILNARLGAIKQIRVWVLVYNNKSMAVFEDQKNAWKNGNKNELVLGFGLKDNKVAWANVFSWTEADEFVTGTRSLLEKQIGKKINLCSLEKELTPLIKKKWVRKQFIDFDYLKVDPPQWAMTLTFLLTLFSSVGLSIFFVANDIQ